MSLLNIFHHKPAGVKNQAADTAARLDQDPTDRGIKAAECIHSLLQTLKSADVIRSKADTKRDLRDAVAKLSDILDNFKDQVVHPEDQPLVDGTHLGDGLWSNWSGNVKKRALPPMTTLKPKTVTDVQEAVSAAKKAGKAVRCIGHGHSWTPVFFDEGTSHVLFMSDLCLNEAGETIQIVRKANKAAGQPARVRVAPGVTTGELGLFCEENFEAVGCVGMSSDIIINTVRYGGVIAMACHGAGRDTGTIPDYVVGIQWVDAEGNLQERLRDNTNDDEFNCAVASMGLLGVTVSITFQLDSQLDKPYVINENVFIPMRECLTKPSDFENLVKENYATEIFWMPLSSAKPHLNPKWDASDWDPKNDLIWFNKFTQRVDAKREDVQVFENRAGVLERTETQLGALANKIAQKSGSLLLQGYIGKLATSLLQLSLQAEFGWLKNGIKTLPKAIHYQQSVDDYQVYDMELVFPVAADFSNVFNAWNTAVELATASIKKKKGARNVMNVALECRFTRGSTAVLSPAYTKTPEKGDFYCWMEVLASAATPLEDWMLFVEQVYDAWLSIAHPGPAKLHWAKWMDFERPGSDVAARLAKKMREQTRVVYGEQLSTFRAVAQKHDPSGRFRTQWLSDVVLNP